MNAAWTLAAFIAVLIGTLLFVAEKILGLAAADTALAAYVTFTGYGLLIAIGTLKEHT